ncbi:MAG: glycosyltransferase family 2 protein, partial [Bacteroidales bacterium]|nr:glycosyltransferase family 2 protein [Candidatus Liminaster caballi]
IIPVYNAGSYLRPCVDSLRALPFDKEIIIVDDGSTDGGPSDTKAAYESSASTKATHEVIKIIRQENQGVSAARNRGLQEAKGDWIWFVDADDMVYESYARKLCEHESPSDTKAMHESSADTKASLVLLPFEWEEDGQVTKYMPHDGEVPYNLWRCWFRRSEIERQGLRFTAGRKYAEDQEFILRFLLKQSTGKSSLTDGENAMQSVIAKGGKAWAEGPVYHYVMRSSGAMRKSGTKRKQMKDIWCVWCRFFFLSIGSGQIGRKWVWKELKRLAKTWYVTALS